MCFLLITSKTNLLEINHKNNLLIIIYLFDIFASSFCYINILNVYETL